MTVLHEQIAEALVRSTAVAVVSLLVAVPLRDFLMASSRRSRASAWMALLAPYITPSLLVGYAYAPVALALLRQPAWSQFLYGLVLLLRFTPVAALVLHFAPPPLSPEAAHCYDSLQGQSFWKRLCFKGRGAGAGPAIAFVLVFIFCFSEFELASMWTIKTWGVTIFDRHAGGLPPSESLRLTTLPAAIQTCLLLVVAVLLARGQWSRMPGNRVVTLRAGARWFSGGYLAAGVLGILVAPVVTVLASGFPGFSSLFQNFAAARDVGASFLFAFAASCSVTFLAWLLAKRTLLALVFAVIGLFGALPIALVMVALFQAPLLRSLYDTPLPLLLALTLILFPTAWLLRSTLRAVRPGPALHLAQILANRRLVWDLKAGREFWAAYLLFCLAYFELTASAIAAPVGMTPVVVRLFNLMHYGRTAVLSALLCVSLLAPLALLVFAFAGRLVVPTHVGAVQGGTQSRLAQRRTPAEKKG